MIGAEKKWPTDWVKEKKCEGIAVRLMNRFLIRDYNKGIDNETLVF